MFDKEEKNEVTVTTDQGLLAALLGWGVMDASQQLAATSSHGFSTDLHVGRTSSFATFSTRPVTHTPQTNPSKTQSETNERRVFFFLFSWQQGQLEPGLCLLKAPNHSKTGRHGGTRQSGLVAGEHI